MVQATCSMMPQFNYHNKALAAHGTCVGAKFALSPELQAKERLLNARMCFSSLLFGQDTEARDALGRIKYRLARDAEFDQSLAHHILAVSARPTLLAQLVLARFLRIPSLIKHSRFQAIVEPLPVTASRVTLSSDATGLA
jgi:hypothetical protein